MGTTSLPACMPAGSGFDSPAPRVGGLLITFERWCICATQCAWPNLRAVVVALPACAEKCRVFSRCDMLQRRRHHARLSAWPSTLPPMSVETRCMKALLFSYHSPHTLIGHRQKTEIVLHTPVAIEATGASRSPIGAVVASL